MALRVLVIGGYGIFGGRLIKLMADEEKLTFIIAGRSMEKAAAFCKSFPSRALREPARFDRDLDVEKQISQIKTDMVVDATGPYQLYGAEPYRVVKACINLGIDYMDFADGADFVKGISQFDGEAKRKNIFILSGVSSFPVLTAAVARSLSRDLSRVDSIKAGIAPSPFAIVGLNVIRAIASYAGKPIKLIRDRRLSEGHALTESMRYTICPPGKLPLRNIRFSLVDVPDLQVIPDAYPGLGSIWIGAGTVPEMLHRMLNGLAWLVRLKLLPSLTPFAGLFHFVISHLRWGEHRGGMFLEMEGVAQNGDKVRRSWHLLAEGEDGPFIPSMAIAALTRRRTAGMRPTSGARPSTGDLELADYDDLFKNRTICTGVRDEVLRNDAPLYRKILGDAWHALPPAWQDMHNLKSRLTVKGTASVERGSGWLANIIAALFRFPPAGQNIPITVEFTTTNKGELWRRTFGTQSFSSFQFAGQGRLERLLCERFGPFTFGLALVVENSRMHLVVRHWRFLGLPMPMFLGPENNSYEHIENGVFHFNVEIGHKFAGRIVSYRGRLTAA